MSILTISKKHIILFLIIMLIIEIIPLFSKCMRPAVATSDQIDFGLGYAKNNTNTPPTGPLTSEEFKNLNSYYLGDTNEKNIYLTFDGGYEDGYTESILDTLKANNVKACFFLTGHYLDSAPELVKRMHNEGHLVGNHTENHPKFSKLKNLDVLKSELSSVEEKYKAITGSDINKLYRPPHGSFSVTHLNDMKDMGYKTIFWSLAYVDWDKNNQPTHDYAFNKLIPRLHNGAIILLHNTSRTNMEILDSFIKKVKDLGYTFKTLDELN